ncbi:hypothetical protein [Flavivirga jejuensis]|uniref:Uncharacterized protein n=1 Tax=Flavivirga jejuensis TaxID=870487 RepID=A0ABT8WW66_9FLAO|nr:hypothetical protein [Flavivirga jejuensis]MDO5977229.1 hypothetical protein [Flavivirga jejuensis]
MDERDRTEKRYASAGIGYPIGFDEVALETIDLIAEKAKVVQVEKGYYLHYIDPSGAELWQYHSEDGEPNQLKPYFEGNTTYFAFLNMIIRNHDCGFYGIGASCSDEPIHRKEDVKLFMSVVLPTGHAYKNLLNKSVQLKVTAIPKSGTQLLDFSYTKKTWNKFKENNSVIPFLAKDFVKDETGEYPLFEGNNQIFLLIQKVEQKTNTSNGREFIHVTGEVDKGFLLDVVVETTFFPPEAVLPGRSMYGEFTLHGVLIDKNGKRV